MIIFCVSGIFSFFGCQSSRTKKLPAVEHAPFLIKKKHRKTRRYDINTASKVTNAYTLYNIIHNDKPVLFPEGMNKNTGVPGVWKAYILSDAPKPTLLAASQSVYLVSENENDVAITTVHEQNDFAKLQWLDSLNGQPGEQWELYAEEESDPTLQLKGGEYLLVSEQVVLHIPTLTQYPIKIDWNRTMDYDPGPVLGFAPSKNSIAFLGSQYNDGKWAYSVTVINFKNGMLKTLPFDRTATRFYDPWESDHKWLNTYFNWDQDDAGNDVIVQRQLDSLPYWQGHFGKGTSFSLSPTKADMALVFVDFIEKHLNLEKSALRKQDHGVHNYDIYAGSSVLSLSYLEDLQSTLFSISFMDKDESKAKALLNDTAHAFNEKLSQGAHQELFTQF